LKNDIELTIDEYSSAAKITSNSTPLEILTNRPNNLINETKEVNLQFYNGSNEDTVCVNVKIKQK
jgi:hypothetical protein